VLIVVHAVLLLGLPCAPALADGTGAVLDGDTLEVLHPQHPDRIRLSGIDCPEKGQAYGARATHAASALAFGKDVTIQTHGLDKYRRTLGNVILLAGTNVHQELVTQGWWWWYRTYASGDTVLNGLAHDAREGRKGLWADPPPVPP
jgi:micrococcal nuclease